MTIKEIEAKWSAGPSDWDAIWDYAKSLWDYDKFNVATVDAGDMMVLLECRRELIRRESEE